MSINSEKYTVLPLTRKRAEQTGHIAWIEGNNANVCLRAMFESVRHAPCNLAVWANAGDFLPPETDKLVADWRRYGDIMVDAARLNYYGQTDGYDDIGFLKSSLRDAFEAAAEHEQALRILRDHMLLRIDQFNEALPIKKMLTCLRATKSETTRSHLDSHIDGNVKIKDGSEKARLIETIASPGTFIYPNDQAIFIPNQFPMPNAPKGRWDLKPKGPHTVLQTPPGSMALITNTDHHCQPILHGVPRTREGEQPERRTVLVYDITI